MLFTVGPMLLGILPVLISTINKVYNNNNKTKSRYFPLTIILLQHNDIPVAMQKTLLQYRLALARVHIALIPCLCVCAVDMPGAIRYLRTYNSRRRWCTSTAYMFSVAARSTEGDPHPNNWQEQRRRSNKSAAHSDPIARATQSKVVSVYRKMATENPNPSTLTGTQLPKRCAFFVGNVSPGSKAQSIVT